jgi:hypothetical protein
MSDPPAAARLSGEEIQALRFAAHRQLTRWANKPNLSPDQHTRRNALKRAAAVLHEHAFTHGCQLHTSQPPFPRHCGDPMKDGG